MGAGSADGGYGECSADGNGSGLSLDTHIRNGVQYFDCLLCRVPPPGILPYGKFAQVDTSKYIWSKDGGGARPLPVKWGQLGRICVY